MISFLSLVETREYHLPHHEDEDEWVVECRLFLDEVSQEYLPRLYRRSFFKLNPSDEKYENEFFDEVILTEEPFLWDSGERIQNVDTKGAFNVVEAKMLTRLGHTDPKFEGLLQKIVENA